MTFLLVLPALLSLLTLAAHFLRENSPLLTLACLALCFLLLIPRNWVARLTQGVLVFGALVWIQTTWAIMQTRMTEGRDWKRAAVIFSCVTAFTLLAAALFQTRRLRTCYSNSNQKPHETETAIPPTSNPAPTPQHHS